MVRERYSCPSLIKFKNLVFSIAKPLPYFAESVERGGKTLKKSTKSGQAKRGEHQGVKL